MSNAILLRTRFIARYINLMNESEADNATIMANFPNKMALDLGINLVKLMDKIEETKELGSAIDELLA